MMKVVTEHKSEIKKQLTKTVEVMKIGVEKSKAEAKANEGKLEKRLAEITKKMEKGDKAAEETRIMIEEMEKGMAQITEDAHKQQKQHHKHEKEMAALQEEIVGALGKMEKMEDNMVEADQLDELQSFILKVNSKVGTMESEIDQEVRRRKADVEALAERVTKNEDHLDEVEGALDAVDSDLVTLSEIMADVADAQKGIKDDAVKA